MGDRSTARLLGRVREKIACASTRGYFAHTEKKLGRSKHQLPDDGIKCTVVPSREENFNLVPHKKVRIF